MGRAGSLPDILFTFSLRSLQHICGREKKETAKIGTTCLYKRVNSYSPLRSRYSAKHFVRCYPCERQQAFFDAHLHAFVFFGGIFPVLVYDNLTAAVRQVLHGRGRVEQTEFTKFHAYYNFRPRFCNPAAAHEKVASRARWATLSATTLCRYRRPTASRP